MSTSLLRRLVGVAHVRHCSLHGMQVHCTLSHLQSQTQRGMFHMVRGRLLSSKSSSNSLLASSPADCPPAQRDDVKPVKVKTSSQGSCFYHAKILFHKQLFNSDFLLLLPMASQGFHSSASLHKKKKKQQQQAKERDTNTEDDSHESEEGRGVNIRREDLIEDEINRDLVEQMDLSAEESDLGREVSVTALVEMLTGRMVEQGRQTEPSSNQQLQQQVEHLLHNGFSPSLVLHLLSRRPDLAASQRWHPLLQSMLLHGLTPRRLTHMLINTDNLAQVSVRQFTAMVHCLRGVGLSDTQLLRLLSLCPRVIGLPPRTVVACVSWLRDLFKTKDVMRLLCSCPSLLFEDMAEVQEKFDYAFYRMGVSQRQMMHSDLFTYDLSHLQTRHAFVERSGFFSSSRRREGERNSNPRLDQIIDTTDKAFARRFGNMTMEDYAAFKTLFEVEMAEMRRREAEGSSSDEDEDGDKK